jgi:hypothetical protein
MTTKLNRQFYAENSSDAYGAYTVVSRTGPCLYTNTMFSATKKCATKSEATDLAASMNAAFSLGYAAAQKDMKEVLGLL